MHAYLGVVLQDGREITPCLLVLLFKMLWDNGIKDNVLFSYTLAFAFCDCICNIVSYRHVNQAFSLSVWIEPSRE